MVTEPAATLEVSCNYIGGRWVPGRSEEVLRVFSPITGEAVVLIPTGTPADALAAVQAARVALAPWQALTVEHRGELVRAAFDRLAAATAELAELQHVEMGQPVDLAVSSLTGSLAEVPSYTTDAASKQEERLAHGRVVRRGRGVAALIVPWNFPLPVALDGLAPLLLTGNCVVWKPSERSPLSAIRAMDLLSDVLPPGVVNLLLGDARAGQPLVDADIDLVVFTGSVATGRKIGESTGRRLIKAVLELGGKDPVIIDADVDPQWAARQVLDGAFQNSGQLCTSMERIYVHHAVAHQFITSLVEQTRHLHPGPLVDQRQRAIVAAQVEDAVARGARVVVGGDPPEGGSYYPPTVLVDVPDDANLMREETFGPIAPVTVVSSFDEALQRANETMYGLGATVFTRNEDHVGQASAVLQAALIWINEWKATSPGWTAEPKRSSGLGAGWGPGLIQEVTSSTYVHEGSTPPSAPARRDQVPSRPSQPMIPAHPTSPPRTDRRQTETESRAPTSKS